MSDTDAVARAAYAALLVRVVNAATHNLRIEDLRGTALFDTARDQRILTLAEFDALSHSLAEVPLVSDRFGQGSSMRLALQLVYEYFSKTDTIVFNPESLARVWNAFLSELARANWTTVGLANLRCFAADAPMINLGDGLSIRGRNFDELKTFGFDSHALAAIADDFSTGFGQEQAPKSRSNWRSEWRAFWVMTTLIAEICLRQ
jgi:hypothetical protein